MRSACSVTLALVCSFGLLQGCASTSIESAQSDARPEINAAAAAPAPYTTVSKSLSRDKPALEREIVGIRVLDAEGDAGAAQAAAVDNAPTGATLEEEIADNAPAAPQPSMAAVSPQFPLDLVQNIQANLSRHGFDAGVPDGMFGRRTRDAIRAYQEFHSVPVTGEPSSALLKLLLSE